MDISRYKKPSEWYKAMKAEGYQIPLTLYHTLDRMVNEGHSSFHDAYQELLDKGRIEIVNKNITFNLNETKK